ncbi:cytochrome c biogenesis protein CcdA [Smaragdicoccus niigatensis]|uniref:cytochrome c biogenesis protein CcdA n=1 Tax=Smaragdicoccus niigatensis TaxID=359359 RepID=UPI0003728330|nr:cytochrome c biogenesis protein CcdA [Smaragdicoccus niigatensis]
MLTLALIGLVGGLITGVSPCVLPMLPMVFVAGSATTPAASTGAVATLEKSSVTRLLGFRPLLIIAGVVVSFSLFTLVGATLLSALSLPDDLLRWIGLVILGLVGLGLIFPALGHVIERPFYRLPKITNPDSGAFLFGMGLGTLYVPCAGPVLAAITVAGATGNVGVRTVVLTVFFALGAALPLLLFAAAGERAAERIKSYRSRARTLRIIGGVVLIGLAIGLFFNLPDVVQRALPNYTESLEQRLADSATVQGALSPSENAQNKNLSKCTPGASELASCGQAPTITGTQHWFNTADGSGLDLGALKRKVVLIDFFAYSCINCQRDAPYVEAWYERYASSGLVVIGIHTPEFAFEKDAGNVKSAIDREGLTYPIAQDNNLATWTNYRNRFWPAKYLIDADGTVRAIRFGEGSYDITESQIRQLLEQANPHAVLPAPLGDLQVDAYRAGTTPETYLGYERASTFRGTEKPTPGTSMAFTLNDPQANDTFSLGGTWTPQEEYLESTAGARLRLNFNAAKVYHVLDGEGTVTVSIPGEPDRTINVTSASNLYELYSGPMKRASMTLTYSAGIRVYTFTFG